MTIPITKLEQSYLYCKEITKKNASSFYFASKLLLLDQKKAAFAVYAFCRVSDDLVDNLETKPKEQVIKDFNNWKNRVSTAIKAAKATDPILIALLDSIKKFDLNPRWFLDILKGIETDLTKTRFKDFEELNEYCYYVAGVVGLIMTKIIGFTDSKALDFADQMGRSLQITNILRDIKEDWSRGRIYIPLADLKQFNYTEEDLAKNTFNQNFKNLIKFYVQKNRKMYAKSAYGFRFLKPRGRFAMKTVCGVYKKILDKIEKQEYNVLKSRVYTSRAEKAGVLWHLLWNDI